MKDNTTPAMPGDTHPGPAIRGSISPFVVMDIMRGANERQARGENIIHMEVGQPSTPAPRAARDAAKAAIDSDVLGYTDALGNFALRERIARHYREVYGVPVTPERIIITSGSSAAFVLAFLALFDAGARILLPEPGYPCYRNIMRVLGLEPVPLTVNNAVRWMPAAQLLASAGRADGLLFASPANPTGTMLDGPGLREVCEWCRAQGVVLISDEIYHGLSYGAPAQTALAFHDGAIVINSFSKYYSMTGWRVGWMVLPLPLVRTVERLAQNLYISPSAISQIAALAAFDAMEELEANRAVYAANRALLLSELPSAGFHAFAPADGAFYLYSDVSHLTGDSEAFVRRMLAETGVAATPGNDFDTALGAQFVRFSYSGTTAAMEEAVRRLRAWRK
jgi:aspartate/methionine/tyrosine aminotransferase